jgi:hypothetical protein
LVAVASLLSSSEGFALQSRVLIRSTAAAPTAAPFGHRYSTSTCARSDLAVHQLQSSSVYHTPKPNYALVDRSEQDASTITGYQLAVGSALGLVFANQGAVNQQIATFWSFLQQQWWFRHDMFEPAVAVVGFYVAVHAFATFDWAAKSGRAPWLSRFHLPSQKAASEGKASSGYTVTKWYSGWAQEMAVYVLPLWFLSSFTEVRH